MPISKRIDFSQQDDLETVAAEWLARRDAGLTSVQQKEFDAWRAADPAHANVWAKVESAWLAFDAPVRSGAAESMVRELAARQRRRRWKVYATTGAGLAAAAAVVLLLGRPVPVAPPAAPLASKLLLQPELRTLPDGSIAELNTGAEIVVRYQPEHRDIQLVRGEAHFIVQKDPARPFIVRAGKVNVYAVGTAFAVRMEPQSVDVLVTEGKVAVDPAAAAVPAATVFSNPRATSVFVTAGRHVLVPNATEAGARLDAEVAPESDMQRLLAWRGLRLELSGTPLADAVAVLNRQNRLQIVIASEALAKMQMSGVFRADNAEGFVRLLESNYGVEVERRGDAEVVLRKLK